MTDISNLKNIDPFADAAKDSDHDPAAGEIQQGLIHIRIQQRNGRKTLTTVQGLSVKYNLRKISRAFKKEFNCNGTVVEHPEYGEIIQLNGDQRQNVKEFLTNTKMAPANLVKVHGF